MCVESDWLWKINPVAEIVNVLFCVSCVVFKLANYRFCGSHFQSGDPILTVYEGGAVGELGLPAPLATMKCADSNPAGSIYTNFHHLFY